jgi:hypothetical protein
MILSLFGADNISHAQWVHTTSPGNVYIWGLKPVGDNIFAATWGSGIYKSTDGGLNWIPSSNGITFPYLTSIVSGGNKIFAAGGTGESGGGIYMSTDNGDTWAISLPGVAVYCLSISGNNIVAGTYHLGVYLSTDLGASWNTINNGLYADDNFYSIAINDNEIFTGTMSLGVFHSTNLGASWTNSTSGLDFNSFRSLIYSDGVIYAGSDYGKGLFFSNDRGNTWGHRLSGLSVNSIATAPDRIFAGTQAGIYATSNNGLTWETFNSGMPIDEIASLTTAGGFLYAGTKQNGIWRRPLSDIIPVELITFTAETANGKVLLNWKTVTETNNKGFEIQRRTNNSDWTSVQFIKGYGTTTEMRQYSFNDDIQNIPGNQIYYRLKQIDFDGGYKFSKEASVQNTYVLNYSLEQNFPNPFNPNTTIKYALPKAGMVTIKVFDLLGNLVKTLVNENETSGSHIINFDASGLSSGIYVYKIKSGEFSSSKKMMLMK